MLNAAALKKRFLQALKDRQNVTQAAIAVACVVSPQAVTAWKSTGQIDAKHFPTLARILGKPLEYWHGTESATVVALPSQSAGRSDPSMRFAGALADELVKLRVMDRDSPHYWDVVSAAQKSFQKALESEVPDNMVDFAGKLAAPITEETSDVERRNDAGNGPHSGGKDRKAVGKSGGAKRKPKTPADRP